MRRTLHSLSALLGALAAVVCLAPPAAADGTDETPVIQTGFMNYAGPSCPGAGWTCTDATNVIQTTVAAGVNVFECKGGTGEPDDCTITQSADHGLNQARCVEEDAAAEQRCFVTQANVRGRNEAQLRQISRQDGGGATATQSSTQTAFLAQCNVKGANAGHVNQEIIHVAQDAESSNVEQHQTASMSFEAHQTGPPAGARVCPAVDPPTPPDVPSACPRIISKDDVVVHQRVRQLGVADNAVTGHQSQSSSIDGVISQCSQAKATWTATESENQKLRARRGGDGGVEQSQEGPIRCCDRAVRSAAKRAAADEVVGQGVDKHDESRLLQTADQLVLPLRMGAHQVEDMTMLASTTGLFRGTFSVARNDAPAEVKEVSVKDGTLQESFECPPEGCPPVLDYLGQGDVRKRVGRRAVLSAKLTFEGRPVAGELITFTIVGGSESCSAVTNEAGIALCKVRITDPVGFYTVRAAFAGDEARGLLPTDVVNKFHVRCSLDTPGCT